jgi:hypothetical protein
MIPNSELKYVVNFIPDKKDMFRLTIKCGGIRIKRGKHIGTIPARPRSWRRQTGIVAASVLLLPVALLSITLFVGLFLVFLITAVTYGFWLRSRLQRMVSNQVIDGDFEEASDEDNQQKMLKEENDHKLN